LTPVATAAGELNAAAVEAELLTGAAFDGAIVSGRLHCPRSSAWIRKVAHFEDVS